MKYFLGALLACFVILFIINIVDLNRYVVRSIAIYDSKVTKKLKVCFVSDLHNYSCTPKFYEDIREGLMPANLKSFGKEIGKAS